MPSHIYWRVGRYADASHVNVLAAQVDEAYFAACSAQVFSPAAYYPHNIHFLWASSSMEGRSEVSIEAARKVAANVRLEMINEFPGVEFFHTIPLLALTQFGQWDNVLAEPQPPANIRVIGSHRPHPRLIPPMFVDELDIRPHQRNLGVIRHEHDLLFKPARQVHVVTVHPNT